jgi:putative flippase GtrA
MSPEITRFLRFLVTGGVNTGFGYASYAVLVLTGMPLWLAVAGSTSLAILFNFYSYGSLVFGDTSRGALPTFLVFYAALGLANYLGLECLTGIGVGPLLAQAFLVPLLAIGGYLGMRMVVFRPRGKA